MKYNKGFAPVVVLLIVLGVLAVGGVAYFAGKSSTPKNTVSDNYFPTTEQNYTPPTTNNNPPAQTPPPANNPPQQQTPPPTPTCNPSITVLSPNGGEVYTASQKITVKWKSCNLSANTLLQIDVRYKSPGGMGGEEHVLTKTALNNGSAVVTLPTDDASEWDSGNPVYYGNNFYVAIWPAVGGPNIPSDISDNKFTINAPQISTANWKTYTNTGCGYTFQYPDSWSAGNESNAINLQGTIMSRMIDFIDTASQGIETHDGSNNQIYAPKDSMHIECYTMGSAVYSDELSRYNNSSDIFAQTKKTITVGGQTAIVGEMRNTATVSGGEHAGHTVIPSHDMYVFFMHKDQTHSLYFKFSTPLGNGDVAEIAKFEQLLKTFKFN